MKIAIDIDDTLTKVDRVTPAQQYIRENELPFRLLDPDAHAIREIFDWSQEEVMRYIWAGGYKTFSEAPVREGASAAIQKWRAAGHHVTILTARSADWFSDPMALSYEQLKKNQVPYDEVVADVYEKGKYCKEHGISVLIEDNFEICKLAQELGVAAIMFLDKHNEEHKGEIKYTASNWEEVAAAVESILISND